VVVDAAIVPEKDAEPIDTPFTNAVTVAPFQVAQRWSKRVPGAVYAKTFVVPLIAIANPEPWYDMANSETLARENNRENPVPLPPVDRSLAHTDIVS
jgi:hypothetical protein